MGAITDEAIWDYNGWMGGNRTTRLTPGVLDESARDVFMRGHCHSLALALSELLPDAILMGAWYGNEDLGGDLEHVFVCLPDGRMLDVNGATYEETDIIEDHAGWIEILDWEELQALLSRGYFRPAREDDAMPFARTLIEREGIGQMALAA